MNTNRTFRIPSLGLPAGVLGLALLSACGGGGGGYADGSTSAPTPVAPAISADPASATVLLGQGASFSITASGTPAPSAQWERSADGQSWSAIPGATSTALAFTAGKADDGSWFRAKAANSAGTATSAAASLAVHWSPTFTKQPGNQSGSPAASVTFRVSVDANPPADLQWQASRDGSAWDDIPGATSATYETGPTTPGMNDNRYRCLASNLVGTGISAPATLLVGVPSFNLTVDLGPGVLGNPVSTTPYPQGTVVDFAYTPMAGYDSVQVLLDGAAASPSGSLTMDRVHALSVQAAPTMYAVTFAAASGGQVQGALSQSVPHGGSTTAVTAVPEAGHAFLNWSGAGFAGSTANPLVLAGISQNLSLTANFGDATAFTITASAGVWGRISPSGPVKVQDGGSQTFNINPDAYYTVADVLVDGVSVGAVNSYTFTNVKGNHTISATFSY